MQVSVRSASEFVPTVHDCCSDVDRLARRAQLGWTSAVARSGHAANHGRKLPYRRLNSAPASFITGLPSTTMGATAISIRGYRSVVHWPLRTTMLQPITLQPI
jgi:hypothetical protein